MFCGIGSFSHVDDDPSSPSTPKGCSKKKRKSNPYSTMGLDKFSTVLAELEARRETIMAKAGSSVSMVRFMYSNSQDWIPIIVRLREPPKKDPSKPSPTRLKSKSVTGSDGAGQITTGAEPASEQKVVKKIKKSFSLEGWGRNLRPAYYWPVMILLSLVIFGRMFAICCTTIWWYLVPTMEGGSDVTGIGRRSMKRRVSDKRLGGVQELASPRSQMVIGKRG